MTLITQWASDAVARGLHAHTIYIYGRSLKRIEAYLAGAGSTLRKADKSAIRYYIDDCRKRGLATKTIQHHLAALSSFYEYLLFEGLRKDNPVQGVRARYLQQYKANSEAHTHKLISIEEAARLVNGIVDIRKLRRRRQHAHAEDGRWPGGPQPPLHGSQQHDQ